MIIINNPLINSNSNNYIPLAIIVGESNAEGYALNTELTAPQLAVRPAVQILNNTTLLFESLDIGTNNMIGGLLDSTTHGWENGLATSVESGLWSYSQIYLVKVGYSGSVIAQWNDGGSYANSFINRVTAAIALIRAMGKEPLPFIFYTQGINDSNAATSTATWKTKTQALFATMRKATESFAPIISCYFPTTYTTYSTALDELALADPFFYVVQSSDAGLRNTSHWNASGMSLIASRLVAKVLQIGDLYQPYVMKSVSAVSQKTGSVVVPSDPDSWISPQNATVSGYYLTNNGTLPSGAIYVTSVDATQAFQYIISMDTLAAQEGVLFYLDNNNTANFVWQTGLTFISGLFMFSAGIFRATSFDANVQIGTVSGFPAKIKIAKSGNDLLYYISYNDGATYTLLSTHTGVLTGKTTCYIKALYAVAGNFKQAKVVL